MAILLNKPIVCPVLIGRTADLAALTSLVDQAKRGEGQVVLVSGEAGIGKSRLVVEAKSYATSQGFGLLQGNCFPADISCPYAPLLDLLRSYIAGQLPAKIAAALKPFARELFQLLPELAPLLPELATVSLQTSLEPEQEKRRLFAALTQFFAGIAAKQPVMLIIEDLHWSDDTSLEFLHYLARRCAAHPFLLLMTYRNDEVRINLSHWLAQLDRERLAQEFPLARLARTDIDVMLRSIFALPRSVQLGLPDPLYMLTEGNPFFVEEILKSLIVAGEIFYTNGNWDRKPLSELHIPRSIHDAVQRRTEQLSKSARQVLLLAAVAGRRFDFALLQRLTQLDEHQLLALMKELITAQLVVEESEEQFAFRHALTRQAIYVELLARERKALHRTIAETIEQLHATSLDAHLADLAYHFYEAGTWAKALEYAQRAGEKAQSLYSSRAAIEQFTRALEAIHQLGIPAPSKLYHARGQAYETLGEFEHARSDYEQALNAARKAHDGVAEWQSFIDLGSLWAGRDYAQTYEHFQRAFELARAMGEPWILARSLNRVGNWHLNAEEPSEALQCHQEALAVFQRLNDQRGLAETLDLLGMASYLGGDVIQSAVYYEQATEQFRIIEDRKGLISSLATLMICGGNYQNETMVPAATSFAESLQRGELALKIAREIDQRSGEAYSLFQLGVCLGSRGEYARALELAKLSIEIAEEIEHRQWMAGGHWALGALYLDLLSFHVANEHLKQSLALAHEIGSRNWIHIATGSLASTNIIQGDLMRAESILNAETSANTPTQTVGQRMVWCARAELALARGNAELALDITDRLIASAANVSAQHGIARLSKLRGEALAALHHEAEAEAELRTAQEIAAVQGARPLLWRICVTLGNLYRVQSRREEAESAFSTASMIIEELAASIPDGYVQEDFLRQATAVLPRTHSLFSPPLTLRRAAKQAFGGLTQREREVAVLIARGKANRVIADELVVSYRTVETHVGAILSKLGFNSRAQIAVWAVEVGLVKHSELQ